MAYIAKKQPEEHIQHVKKTNTILIAIVAAVAVIALFLLYSSVRRDVAGQAYGAVYDCDALYEQCKDMTQRMADLQQQWQEKYGSGYNAGYCGNMMQTYEQHCDVQKANCESNLRYAQQQQDSYGQGVPAQAQDAGSGGYQQGIATQPASQDPSTYPQQPTPTQEVPTSPTPEQQWYPEAADVYIN